MICLGRRLIGLLGSVWVLFFIVILDGHGSTCLGTVILFMSKLGENAVFMDAC
jgi:hypothetical protein